ncbi:MAG: peptidoglycan-binding protein [Magnetococcales bacterium]|nr:peptidoglycan-binding protein [Magnetococcales bacterium]
MNIYMPSSVVEEVEYPGNLFLQSSRCDVKVKRLQEWLNFHLCGTKIDGLFGSATKSALAKFQGNNNINASGQLDQTTWSLLVKPMVDAMAIPASTGKSYGDVVQMIAKQHLTVRPVEIGGQNCGPWVRAYMKGHDGNNYPWCAGFVSFVLAQSAQCLGTNAPLSYTFSCDDMVKDARGSGLFLGIDHSERSPLIFAKRRTSTDWTHVGFCFSWESGVFVTIEGNTNDQHSREGFELAEKYRSTEEEGYDFIRIT